MRRSNRLRRSVVASAGIIALSAAAHAAVIEFSEVPLVNGTALSGTETFAAYGIHFDGSATYAVDTRFAPNAGSDTSGITTTIEDITMGVIFDAGATSVSFKGFSVNTDFYANVYDASDVLLDSFFSAAVPGEGYVSHTFSGVGTIARIEFHDNNQFIGVGRIEFEPVPEPALLGVASLGIAALARRARRRP